MSFLFSVHNLLFKSRSKRTKLPEERRAIAEHFCCGNILALL